MPAPRIGGSFAPPLSQETLDDYSTVINDLPSSPVKDVLDTLHNCCAEWYNIPESTGTDSRPHSSGIGTIVDLHPDVAKELDPHIPWDHEIEAFEKICNDLPDGLSPSQTVEKEVYFLENGEKVPHKVQVPVVVDQKAKELRDLAHHLLWHVKELTMGREPLTSDKLNLR